MATKFGRSLNRRKFLKFLGSGVAGGSLWAAGGRRAFAASSAPITSSIAAGGGTVGGLNQTYSPKDFKLAGLQGISDQTFEIHYSLYAGYVNNTNLLNEQRAGLIKNGLAGSSDPQFAELTRRLGFEYNGMRLHEYYFSNLTASGKGQPQKNDKLLGAINASFDDYETWKTDFVKVGQLRGVGWAITYQDPLTGALSNGWVTLHERGVLASFKPILVMDVWEHAFLLDYLPTERSKYIEAFFANIDWDVVEGRLA